MAVDNKIICGSSEQKAYIVPAAIIGALVLFAMPFTFWRQIKSQVYAERSTHHEVFLQLKEAEYANDNDLIWATRKFFLFSSYRRRWAYFKVVKLVVKVNSPSPSSIASHVTTVLPLCTLLLLMISFYYRNLGSHQRVFP